MEKKHFKSDFVSKTPIETISKLDISSPETESVTEQNGKVESIWKWVPHPSCLPRLIELYDNIQRWLFMLRKYTTPPKLLIEGRSKRVCVMVNEWSAFEQEERHNWIPIIIGIMKLAFKLPSPSTDVKWGEFNDRSTI